MNRFLASISVVCVAASLASACDEPVAEKTPRKQALESITHDIFIPMLDGVHGSAEELDQAAADFCDGSAEDRSADELAAARDAWSEANERWKRTDIMSFGPHLMSPYRFASDIDFWPARVDDITGVLGGIAGESDDDAGAEPGPSDGIPETLTVSQKGIPAIEYLLFASGDDTLAAFRDGARGELRCAYLQRMTATLRSDTAELRRVFSEDFAPDFTLERNPNDHYASVNDAFAELVNNMIFSIETVRGTRLAGPLGLAVGGVPQPEKVESRFSNESIRSATAVLDGVAMVFLGKAPESPRASAPAIHGIHSVLQARGLDLRDEYQARHDAAVAALEAIPAPLSAAIVDDRERVEAARTAIGDLLMLVQVDIAQALSVTATFGRNDGDGD